MWALADPGGPVAVFSNPDTPGTSGTSALTVMLNADVLCS